MTSLLFYHLTLPGGSSRRTRGCPTPYSRHGQVSLVGKVGCKGANVEQISFNEIKLKGCPTTQVL